MLAGAVTPLFRSQRKSVDATGKIECELTFQKYAWTYPRNSLPNHSGAAGLGFLGHIRRTVSSTVHDAGMTGSIQCRCWHLCSPAEPRFSFKALRSLVINRLPDQVIACILYQHHFNPGPRPDPHFGNILAMALPDAPISQGLVALPDYRLPDNPRATCPGVMSFMACLACLSRRRCPISVPDTNCGKS